MPTDSKLLRQYAEHQDEAAFAEVVRRHTDLVYSVALRVSRNSQLAEDVTQKVFTTLARQSVRLCHYETLVGWLHTAARHGAIDAIRSEERRRAREHEATAMQINSATPEANWEAIGPLLDEAVGQLHEDDRKAVLLRFFNNLSHQELGAALGLSEDTARKRVDRAVEKLRAHFTRRGVTTTSAILSAAITANSVQAAPAGLAAQATKTSLASVAGAGIGGAFLAAIFFMNTKIKIAVAVTVLIVIGATIAFYWPRSIPASPQPVASTPATIPVAPKVVPASVIASPAIIQAPKIAPVAATATVVSSAPSSPTIDAQADLNSVIAEMTTQLQSGNLFEVFKKYISPKFLTQIPPERLPQMEQMMNEALQLPDSQEQMKMMIQGLLDLKDQAPVMNEAGDLATYTIQTEVTGVAITSTNGQMATGQVVKAKNPTTIKFTKIDGKWYLASIPINMFQLDGKWHLTTQIGPGLRVEPMEAK